MAIAIAIRLLISPLNGGIQYVTIFPAVAVVALLCGFVPALISTVAGLVVASIFFWSPYAEIVFQFSEQMILANAIVFSDSIIVSLIIDELFKENKLLQKSETELKDHRDHLEMEISARTAMLEMEKGNAEVVNRAKTLFLGNMSHEMRTPLHQAIGMSRLLRKEQMSEKQLSRVELLDISLHRLESIIGGILTLVDLETRTVLVKRREVVLENILAEIKTTLCYRAEQKGIHVESSVDPRLLGVYIGDDSHIKTIMSCLGNNAVTFSEKGVVSLRFGIDIEAEDSVLVRLEVQDTGIGIPESKISSLFEVFEQADNSNTRKYGGTGAGLAIVKKLSKLMGGGAGCSSTEGVGSVFWSTFILHKKNEVVDFQI
jgi:signal transduction histidine kinase